MKLSSLALALALLPAALFAAGGNSGGNTTTSPGGPTIIPGGNFTSAYIISAPGSYVLGGNRSASETVFVIQIAAPDVTLDLNGFKLSSVLAAGTTVGGGIDVPAPENVEIRNGSIVDTSEFGIRAKTGKDLRVIGVRVVGAKYAGIEIQADATLVERCHVVDSMQYGIALSGAGSLVTDCVVNGFGNALGVGIQSGSRVVRTVVRGCGIGFSVHSSSAVDCISNGNQVGFSLADGSTLRAVDSFKNNLGLSTSQTINVIMGSRITNNTINVGGGGYYTNGGGNLIQ